MRRLVVAIFFVLATVSAAMARDVDGFRGLAWGTDLASLRDRGFERVPDPKGVTTQVESYRRKGDDLRIGEATADAITYNFLKGRLYSVAIDFSGYLALRRVSDYCEDLFGRSTTSMVKDMEYFVSFDSRATGALLYYQFARHGFFVRPGRLFLFSKALDPEAK